MPGFGPNPLAYRVQSGNTVVLLIGSQPIAFAQTVGLVIPLGAEGYYGIGSAKPQEIQQLRIGPEIRLNNFALTALGRTQIQGGVSFPSLIANNQFNVSVADSSGNTVLTYVGCVAQNYNQDIAANRPITEAIDFLSLDVYDNTGQSILNGPSAYSVPGSQGAQVTGGLGIQVSG